MTYVFDASAMIAYLRGESGAEVVRSILVEFVDSPGEARCLAHALNLCEVFYDFHRSGGEESAAKALQILSEIGIETRDDLSPEFWQAVGRLKGIQKRVSLADCFAIVLANRLDASVLTCDHHEFDAVAVADLCRVTFIR